MFLEYANENTIKNSTFLSDIENHLSDLKEFEDIKGHWAYYEIVEAANSHEYERLHDSNEKWKNLLLK